eukprot:PhF_6_TR10792/c0_g1_i3/m.17352
MRRNGDLREYLEKLDLPITLKERLVFDAQGDANYIRLANVTDIKGRPPNSSWSGWKLSCCLFSVAELIPDGSVGCIIDNGTYDFLRPGYHRYMLCGVRFDGLRSLSTIDTAMTHGPVGFVTISVGNIGVLVVGSEFRLLAPGTYQWISPAVTFKGSVPTRNFSGSLGPYSLVTVPEGSAAITLHHGNLRVLGWSEKDPIHSAGQAPNAAEEVSRTFFLDDANWVYQCFFSLHTQTDRLEGNDLLSKDNVEILMVAMSQWRIINPHLAYQKCDTTMEGIRKKVDQLVRATIARIVAGTCIGHGPVSGSVAHPMVMGQVVQTDGEVTPASQDDDDLAHLMQSKHATQYMRELTINLNAMGIDVIGVYVPEKQIKNDDTRSEVSKQAVIGIKAEAQRAAADAEAYATVKAAKAEGDAERQRADAKAYSMITIAKAEADAIRETSTAQSDAGKRLGAPTETAARLALTERTAKCLENANVTIFSGAPSSIPFMFTPSVAGER